MSKLFSPVELGALKLSHRVVHAPMTRMRSDDGDVPGKLMAEYYSQRATKDGLLIAEGPAVAFHGRAYHRSPGIWSTEQTAGWKLVADAVHAKGGIFFTQLWHAGRQSHVDMTGGVPPIAPSFVPFEGVAITPEGVVPVSPHREVALAEIPGLIALFRKGAENAKAAGLDGVELHAANGYLVDQFLLDGVNKRTDAYGGPVENRARLLLEIVEQLVDVWGPERVGVRVSPSGQWGGVSDSDPYATYGYLAEQLNRFNLAYLHIIEPRVVGDDDDVDEKGRAAPVAAAFLRKIFKGKIIVAGGFNGESAEAILQRGDADAVAFGRFFASNPDLVKRLEKGLPLSKYDRDSFYGGDHRGYTDYAVHQEKAVA